MYPYGLIGNCHCAALVSNLGAIDWLCLPRPDSPPVFGRLLDPDGGCFAIETPGAARGQQHYLINTNILVTTVTLEDGSELEITDCCPRFAQDDHVYRPCAIFRRLRPKSGAPRIRVVCQPVDGWSKSRIQPSIHSGAAQFNLAHGVLHFASNLPLDALRGESFFTLTQPAHLVLAYGNRLQGDLTTLVEEGFNRTAHYWRNWVMQCSIPTLHQKETIRSALTLKLHCHEETGAILAALTTSLPEESGQARNWDYRFCWLRDAFFVLAAFYNLGHFSELEAFIKFLLKIAHHHEHSTDRLHPVYALDHSLPLPENIHDNWHGWADSRPVRSNNQAAEHVQNDVYGEMILTLSSIFLDERFEHHRTPEHENLLVHLAQLCHANIGRADAGLWELRDGWQPHSFSDLMGWAGLQKIARIRRRGHLREIKFDLEAALKNAIRSIEMSRRDDYLQNSPKDASLNAALLLLPVLGYPDGELNRKTVFTIEERLRLGTDDFSRNFFYRYHRADDFGQPKSAFVICSFWLVEALARLGHVGRASSAMTQILTAGNELGLFSEHFLPGSRQQLGNFPQAYSHVGLINAAFAISPSWTDHLLAG